MGAAFLTASKQEPSSCMNKKLGQSPRKISANVIFLLGAMPVFPFPFETAMGGKLTFSSLCISATYSMWPLETHLP